MAGDNVGQFGGVVDAQQFLETVLGNQLQPVGVNLECLEHLVRKGQIRFDLVVIVVLVLQLDGTGHDAVLGLDEFAELHPLAAFDEQLHGAVWQLQELKDVCEYTNPVHIIGAGVVHIRLLLGNQNKTVFVFDRPVQGLDRLLPPNKERANHVGEHHRVPQGQDWIDLCPHLAESLATSIVTFLRTGRRTASQQMVTA